MIHNDKQRTYSDTRDLDKHYKDAFSDNIRYREPSKPSRITMTRKPTDSDRSHRDDSKFSEQYEDRHKLKVDKEKMENIDSKRQKREEKNNEPLFEEELVTPMVEGKFIRNTTSAELSQIIKSMLADLPVSSLCYYDREVASNKEIGKLG